MARKLHLSHTHWLMVEHDFDPEWEPEVYVKHPDTCVTSEYGYHCEVSDGDEEEAIRLLFHEWPTERASGLYPFHIELEHYVVPGYADEWTSAVIEGPSPRISQPENG